MLLKDGQAEFETVVVEGENCLNKQERAEYEMLDAECLKEARKIVKDSAETKESWRETSAKISVANRERNAQMLSILENAIQREQEKK